ncbi:hypothetical protein [Butyrivibrio sp. AC2005]|jgi:hypothetical protein|uniref:hypothetical protein n=1 Tax=Butyrivibrio sp. AC2005 TaxID=1280672 RepID=UPI0004154376|nr:hypothetical protein [Butyrivibrio sp. AC2005]
MKKALLSILTTAVLSLFIISCGKDNNNAISPIISLDKSIKENGSILDIIVCCSTTFNEAQKKLSDSKCSFYDEDECLKSEQPTTFCGFPSNFESGITQPAAKTSGSWSVSCDGEGNISIQ